MNANKTQYLLQKKFPNASLEIIDTKMRLNAYCDIFSMMDDYREFGIICLVEAGILVELDLEF